MGWLTTSGRLLLPALCTARTLSLARARERDSLARLSEDAALIVTDEYPCFFLPHAVAAASTRVAIRLEAVDSNGLLPLAAVPQAYPAAVHQRRFMQSSLRVHLAAAPSRDRFGDGLPPPTCALPEDVALRWPAASPALLGGDPSALAAFRSSRRAGGRDEGRSAAAAAARDAFVRVRLEITTRVTTTRMTRGPAGFAVSPLRARVGPRSIPGSDASRAMEHRKAGFEAQWRS